MGKMGRRKEGARVAFNFLFKESSVLFKTKKKRFVSIKSSITVQLDN